MKLLFSDWQWGPMTIQNVVSVKTQKSSSVHQSRGNIRSYQLGIKFTGHSTIRYNGYHIEYRSATVVYLPKEETEAIEYTTLTDETGNGVCIFFDSELPLPKEPQILTGVDGDIENAFLKVLHTYIRSDIFTYPDIMEAFYSLLAKLNRMNLTYSENNDQDRFRSAILYMQKHRDDGYLDICRTADTCGMSEKYFRDSFQKAFGISPLQYFHKMKVEHIRALISDLSLSIAEISEICGFSDPNYFSRFFKKHLGISPTEYRKYYCRSL